MSKVADHFQLRLKVKEFRRCKTQVRATYPKENRELVLSIGLDSD
jgi:hypothetical protein